MRHQNQGNQKDGPKKNWTEEVNLEVWAHSMANLSHDNKCLKRKHRQRKHRTLVFKFQQVSQLPGGLVKTRHRVSDSLGLGGPKDFHF